MVEYISPFKRGDKIIELGGGDNPRFHPNLDIRQLPNVDKVIDVNNPLPISNEEYDGVYCRYLLEHISWRRTKDFLAETYRIIKPGGIAVFVTANLLEQAKVLVNTTEWNNNLIGMIFGAQDFSENTHQNGFSPEYITKILKDIGFQDIKIVPINSDFGPTDMVLETKKYVKKYEPILDKSDSIKIITGVDRQNWVIQHCELGKKILDIGSQDGHTFRDTPLTQSVTFIDLDIYDFPGFIQMDAHNLKFENKSFDIAVLGEILEHCYDPVQVLKEANRVSKRLLITVPDEWNWDKSLYPFETIEQGMKRRNMSLEEIVRVSNPQAKGFYTEDSHRHLFHNRYYTQQTFRQDLEKAGIADYEMTLLQYGQPQWSFFVVDTMSQNIVPTELTIKGPIITQGPIIPKDELKILKESNLATQNIHIFKNNLRIALISTPFFTIPPKGYSGLEQIVWDLAEVLDELGHIITIFGPEGSKSTDHGFVVHTGPSINTIGVDWFEEEKKAYEKYKKIITPEKFDIIHGHNWFGFEYLHKINNPTLRVIHSHHGGYNWESAPPVPKPNLVAISNYMKLYTEQYFKQRGYNIQSDFVYNGADLSRYSFDPTIKKTNRLLYVGRFSRFKQPDAAIRVAKRSNLPIDLIGGTFVDDQNYLHQIESMCDGKDIVIHKDAPHEFKIKKLQEAKALIVPSKMSEPFGLTCIEGMACGTPVIATRDGAIPEIVIDGETGFICNTEDEMVEAINNIDRIDPLKCRKHIENNFSRLKMAREYEKLYQKMMNDDNW